MRRQQQQDHKQSNNNNEGRKEDDNQQKRAVCARVGGGEEAKEKNMVRCVVLFPSVYPPSNHTTYGTRENKGKGNTRACMRRPGRTEGTREGNWENTAVQMLEHKRCFGRCRVVLITSRAKNASARTRARERTAAHTRRDSTYRPSRANVRMGAAFILPWRCPCRTGATGASRRTLSLAPAITDVKTHSEIVCVRWCTRCYVDTLGWILRGGLRAS